ncbi:MAG: hypothetical protein IT384_14580 [Deltaproteobacteria bacterium]|nr:hypothetical protein [Deltaproteobacteria bacterium]
MRLLAWMLLPLIGCEGPSFIHADPAAQVAVTFEIQAGAVRAAEVIVAENGRSLLIHRSFDPPPEELLVLQYAASLDALGLAPGPLIFSAGGGGQGLPRSGRLQLDRVRENGGVESLPLEPLPSPLEEVRPAFISRCRSFSIQEFPLPAIEPGFIANVLRRDDRSLWVLLRRAGSSRRVFLRRFDRVGFGAVTGMVPISLEASATDRAGMLYLAGTSTASGAREVWRVDLAGAAELLSPPAPGTLTATGADSFTSLAIPSPPAPPAVYALNRRYDLFRLRDGRWTPLRRGDPPSIGFGHIVWAPPDDVFGVIDDATLGNTALLHASDRTDSAVLEPTSALNRLTALEWHRHPQLGLVIGNTRGLLFRRAPEGLVSLGTPVAGFDIEAIVAAESSLAYLDAKGQVFEFEISTLRFCPAVGVHDRVIHLAAMGDDLVVSTVAAPGTLPRQLWLLTPD